jgi:hypothetical protein
MKVGAALLAPAFGILIAQSGWTQSSETIGVHLKQWWPELSGSVRADTALVPGTDVDFSGDLGLDMEPSGITELGIWGNFPLIPFRVFFTAYGGAFDHTEFLEQPETFNSTVIPGGTVVRSELSFRAYTLMFDFGVGSPRLLQSGLQFGVQIGVQFTGHRIEITPQGGATMDENLEAPIPMLGARASLRLGGLFEIYALLQGISTEGISDTFSGHYIDATIELRWWATPGFAFGGGYRIIRFIGEDETAGTDRFEVELSGFFVSIVVNY